MTFDSNQREEFWGNFGDTILNSRDSYFPFEPPLGRVSAYGVFYQVHFQDLLKNGQYQEVLPVRS